MGATTSTFPYTASMRAYLQMTGRAPVARAADEAAAKGYLSADEGAEYDEIIEVVRVMDVNRRYIVERRVQSRTFRN